MPIIKELWATGILVAFSVFGIKVGLGLGAQVFNRFLSGKRKAFLVMGTLFVYLTLFLLMFFLITRINLLNHLDRVMNLIQHGMLLHLLVAAGLIYWGVQLLLKQKDGSRGLPLKASLLLILPCPVCATVILLNLTLAYSIFSLTPLSTTVLLFLIFIGLASITVILAYPFRDRLASGNQFLGVSMNVVALYFFMTVLIAPIYPEIKAAFAMARSNTPVQSIEPLYLAYFLITLTILLSLGYFRAFFRNGASR